MRPSPCTAIGPTGSSIPAADAISAGFIGLLCVVVLALTLAARRMDDVRGLGLAGLASAAALASLGKVLSPQFMLWLVPLAAVAFAWGMYALGVVAAPRSARRSCGSPTATSTWSPARTRPSSPSRGETACCS